MIELDYRPMLDCLLGKEQLAQYLMSPSFRRQDRKDASCLPLRWRHKICEWYYGFIDHCNFDREVVGVAMNYFDRYIMIHSDSFDDERSRTHEYQIVAVAALFLAIKIHATSCEVENIQEVRAQALSKILYGTVKQQDIFVMEMDMLIAFEWHVYPPTMHQFAFLFFQLHPLGPTSTTVSYLYEATRYQVELAVFVPALMLGFKPSVVVVAAMKNAEERIETDCPGILTNEMKQSFERMLMEDPSIIIDPNAVAQCQLLFKRVCPQLPDLDYFSDIMMVTPPFEKQLGRNDSISPTNVADF